MRSVALAATIATGALAGVVEGPASTRGWEVTGRAAKTHKMELVFAVKQRNTDKLHDALMAVSDPKSARYGKHLSNTAVHDLVAPASRDIAAVEKFIRDHGATPKRATMNGDFISADVTVETAERMLGAKYVQLRHSKTNSTVHRAPDGYSLPDGVAAAVDFVSPTVHVPGVQRVKKAQSGGGDSTDNTPKNLRELYGVGTALGKAPTNKQAVTAFLKQYYSLSDLQSFWNQYCTGITCGKGDPKLVGDATTGSPGVEGMLDIESITGVAGNIESEYWGFSGSSPDNKENEPFMKWLTQMSSTSDEEVPKLFSTSYGEDENSWSLAAAQRLNVEFQKAGTRGITLLYASGDEGANCVGGKFVPETPSSSPYVTAVGGTAPGSNFPSPGSETAIGLSSGGFSNRWAMPDYQKDAVAAYLKQSGLPPASRGYNTTGRAYPDIAAQATNFCVTPFGCGVAGTSCASPTAAGVISLLNDLRIQNGKSTLGFLNPFIYSHGSAFNDITTGSNDGCDFSGGWPAKKGWDAVTGMGTPNYETLAKAVLALP
eukprot:TRINITY_DN189_c0_g1_i1.p1 TRINITY_DN189_c0_g1~~TRINITY_DN189_c0_g1_i1.p1  ORF type:complete len:544 (+),score=205.96 TRINITY_DN189_c0_g1_i1:70-1701(+)